MNYIYKIFALLMTVVIFSATEVNANQKQTGGEEYLLVAEKMAAPIGGLDAIMKKINYPNAAKQLKIEGRVIVLVMIDEKGAVDDVKVVRGIGGGCDEEVVRVVRGHRFTPAEDKGVPVKSKLSMPFQFRLN